MTSALAADPLPTGQLDTAPKLALVIGVDAYDKGWPKRQSSVRDAKLVGGEFLRHGYKVAILENPTALRLRRALKQFLLIDGEHPDTRLFIWFSGHAHTLGSTSYLVPSDGPLPRRESEFVKTALPLDEYADLLRRSPAAQIYTVIDAPVAAVEFDARRAGSESARNGAPHLPVRQFLSSAAVGQAAADDGAFRRLFLRALAGINRADANLDKVLTADEMGAYMANRVAALTKNRQTPLYGRMAGREFAGGDFAFRVGSSHRLDLLATGQGRDRLAEVAEIEKVLWSSIEDSEDPRKFESFLKVYPDGAFAEKAYARLVEAKETPSRAVAGAAPPSRPARPQPEAVAMSVALPSQTTGGGRELPRDGVELAQTGSSNPFDAPIYPGLPILSMDTPPRPALAAPPPVPAPQEIRRVSAMKPIPLEPGGEMAVPLIEAPARQPPPDVPPAVPTSVSPRAAPVPPPETRPVPVAAVPPPLPRAEIAGSSTVGRMVQIGAFRDQATAERALAEWRSQVPGVFVGREPAIQFADLGARGTFYRVRIGGLADSRAAGEFCAAFKGAGRDCYVVP